MDKVSDLARKFSYTSSKQIGQTVEQIVEQAIMQRRSHERRWYDNDFFDDGYHFRTLNKKTGQVIDHVNRGYGYVERAIPRASRQIRGVANLLFAAEPYPVVYPKRITVADFRDEAGQVDLEAYKREMDANKQDAKKKGTWLTNEWDEKEMWLQIIDMIILAMKNSVSFMQVYSDTEKQEIIIKVLDAFDVICFGDRRNIDDLPFITKAQPQDIREAQTNPLFDPAMAAQLTPDNKYATSEIKDAYMRSRYGAKLSDKEQSTIIIKETFLKEFLSEKNWEEAMKMDAGGAMEGKSKGDIIMRHVFSAGGITLRDEYINYDKYPFADFRMEPGPLYQVPFMERFIPQNKSLDVMVTRLEKWINAMIVGVYQKRKGENFQVSNFPGGQIVEYETTPLTQMNTSSVGNTPFNVINLMDKYLDEQGAGSATGQALPTGVKSGVAIESVKATEYANLKISTLMLKKTIKYIAECMIERAHKDYLEPKEVETLEDGEPNYFDVIGKRGFDLSQQVGKDLPEGITVIDKDTKIKIEIEPGMGLTMEGKRQAMQSIIDYLIQLSDKGYIPQEAMTMVVKRFMETFGYGSTQEFMEAIDEGATMGDLTDEQIAKVKVGLLETLNDAGIVGPKFEETLVNSSKVGSLEALNDAGMVDKPEEAPVAKPPSESIAYKDLDPVAKSQMLAKAGIDVSPQQIMGYEQIQKQADMEKQAQEAEIKNREVDIKEKAIATKNVVSKKGGTK